MKFNEYQNKTRETAVYPEEQSVEYLTLGLNGEAGEVAEKVKKWMRDEDPEYINNLEKEIGDVLWYLARLSDELGIPFDEIANENLEKLSDRDERNVIHGDGDNR